MSRSKRPADSDIDNDDEQSQNDFSDVSTTLSAGARKRPRISNDTASISEQESLSNDDHASTPQSDYGEDGDEEEATQATQAIRERKAQERQHGDQAAECGILERVDLWDFMCHTEFTYKLGPHINFICGKNGSGKSAILTAIILCLGGKASATNRGQSLKKFIKEGRDQARIACTIKNQGEGAYLPEDFGNSIIVERQFSRSGSSGYKIKNERGRIISTKRSDLENILDYFSLQIDNPLNVLSQDQARTFIQTSDPSVKYRFFIKGVQLEQLDQDYSLIEEQVDSINAKLEKTQEDVDELDQKAKEAKQKEELAKQNDGLRSRHRELRRQYAWVQVQEEEDKSAQMGATIEEWQQSIEEVEAEIERLDEVYQASDRADQAAKDGMNAAGALCNQSKDDQRESQAVYDAAKQAMREAHREERKVHEQVAALTEDIKETEAKIVEEEEKLRELDGGGAAARLQALDDAKTKAEQARQDLEGHRDGRRNLNEAINESKRQVEERKKQKASTATELESIRARVDDLTKNKDQQDQAFHPNTDKLLDAIGRETRWEQKPIGPLGKHVRLTRPEWSSIIESTFGGSLSGFFVFSKRDADVLNILKQRVNCRADVFIGNRQLITPNEPDERYDTILRVLEIDNPYVKKHLIINHMIEQTLLIPDIDKATKEMYDGGRLKNVRASFSFHPTHKRRGIMLKYTGSGYASQDPIPEWRGQARMRTNIEATIALAQQNLEEAREQNHTAETNLTNAREEAKKASEALVRYNRREEDLKLASQEADDDVNRLEDEIKEGSIENGRLEVLKRVLKDHQDNKALSEAQYQDAVIAKDRKKDLLHEAMAAAKLVNSRVEELNSDLGVKKATAVETDKKRTHDLFEKNEAVSRVEFAKKDKEQAAGAKAEQDEKIADYIGQARQICERINLPEGATSESIFDKMERLKKDIQRFQQQQLGMSVQEAAEAYAKAYSAYKQAIKDNRSLEAISEQLKQSLNERRERWLMFRRLISTRAKAMFVYLLSERSFRGKILTDHRKKLLEVNIEPDITTRSGSGRNTKTLSGGEKSFSQICLLLSIWEAMGSPIRCLDEFDVYMDAVNRAMSVKMIVEAARGSSGRQYILISPGSKGDIPRAPDVNVVELDKPERGQQTLQR